MSFLSGLNEKILERREQERTKPAAIAICVLEPGRIQYLQEKILRAVLRVLRGIAAPADKHENGPPIDPTKLLERVVRLLLFALRVSSGKDQAPAGRGELTRLPSTLFADLNVHERTL